MPPPSRSHGAMPPPLALRLAPQLPPPRRPGGGGGSPPLLLPPPRFAPYHVPETLSSSSPASHYLPPPLNRQRTSSQGPPLFQSPYLEPPIGTDLHGGGGIGRARGLHAGTTSHPCYPVAAALPLEVPPPAEQLFLVRHHHDSYRHSHMLGHPQGQPGSNSTEQHTSQWEPREHRHHHLRDLDGYMVRVSSSPSLASFSPKAHLDADHDERNTVLGRSSNAWSHRAPSFQRSQERQHYYQRSESPAIGGTVCNHWGHRGAGWGSESWIKEEEDLWPEAEAPTAPLQEELLLRSPEVDRSLDGDSVGQSGSSKLPSSAIKKTFLYAKGMDQSRQVPKAKHCTIDYSCVGADIAPRKRGRPKKADSEARKREDARLLSAIDSSKIHPAPQSPAPNLRFSPSTPVPVAAAASSNPTTATPPLPPQTPPPGLLVRARNREACRRLRLRRLHERETLRAAVASLAADNARLRAVMEEAERERAERVRRQLEMSRRWAEGV